MISPLPTVSPLTLARRRCVGSAGPPVAIPLDGGATWHPRDGLVTHESLAACAAYVVAHTGALWLCVGASANGGAGLSCALYDRLVWEAREQAAAARNDAWFAGVGLAK